MSEASDRPESTRSPIDIAGGVFLLAIAALGYVGGFELPVGHLSGIGSGLMPKALSVLVAAFGVLLMVQGMISSGPVLERWAIRGPFFVLGAVVLFAMTIRPCGLIIAGPLSVIASSLGAKDTKPGEIAIFSVAMTMLSGLLFKELLSLPIPFDPLGLVPEAVFHAYLGLKDVIAGVFGALKNILAL